MRSHLVALPRVRSGLAVMFACGALASAGTASAAGVPKTITHQGRLYDGSSKPVSGTLAVKFAIYADATTTTALWTETDMLTFDEGYFSVSLGASMPFTATLFDGSVRYLGITVGADPEMTPRAPVQSVPYAILAGDVNGDIHPTSVIVNGTTVIDSTGTWTGGVAGLQGPAGPVGPAGAAGAQGPAGPVGPQGPVGAAGVQGPMGPAGPAGPQGIDGATGLQGTPGTTGADGQSVTGTPEASGPNCANGGVKYVSVSGTAYVCNGTSATAIRWNQWSSYDQN